MPPSSQTERVAYSRSLAGLPPKVGVGFKPVHFAAISTDAMPPAFVEVHAENYMGAGGAPLEQLRRVRQRLPLSLHGVGLSIGGPEPLDEAHLARLAGLIEHFQPGAFSEHLAWSSHGGTYFNDLLPIAYDTPALVRVCDHVDRVHERLGVRMLLENPATYVEFEASTFAETAFLSEIVRRTGCGLLLDVNNVYVTCSNHGRNTRAYIDGLPLSAVGEIHLAGHSTDSDADGELLLIDSHDGPVADPVLDLFAYALRHTGPVPTLIEWDNRVPGYSLLCAEAIKATRVMERVVRARGMEAA
jgi:uncharacterized protein (UPF0276 family)